MKEEGSEKKRKGKERKGRERCSYDRAHETTSVARQGKPATN
jgi:hypothetical protein